MTMALQDMACELSAYGASRAPAWDSLWQRRSINRIAVAVTPGEHAIARAREEVSGLRLNDAEKPEGWTPAWDDTLRSDLANFLAGLRMPGNAFLSLHVPRFVHSQSQGICDLFGARVEHQPDENEYVHPLRPDPSELDVMRIYPLETSRYWGAVEYIRYARACTGGLFEFRNPVMTGPFDTANYLLGTMALMEWVYAEPEALQRLLAKITGTIIGMLRMLRAASGGTLNAAHFYCLRGGSDFCSECRSLVSRKIYETFEAPWLRRIGAELGPYAIHSCGSWERTVPSALADPNLRAMNGQIRENDLAELCAASGGRMTFSIAASANLDERYTWASRDAFYRFVLKTVPPDQPFEISVPEADFALWNELCHSGGENAMGSKQYAYSADKGRKRHDL